jgi:hypothetical protein
VQTARLAESVLLDGTPIDSESHSIHDEMRAIRVPVNPKIHFETG